MLLSYRKSLTSAKISLFVCIYFLAGSKMWVCLCRTSLLQEDIEGPLFYSRAQIYPIIPWYTYFQHFLPYLLMYVCILKDYSSALCGKPQRVHECLQKSLKIAHVCILTSPVNSQLFIHILDHYVFYYEYKKPIITDRIISGLVALIWEHMNNIGIDGSSAFVDTRSHIFHIIWYIKQKKIKSNMMKIFVPIVCWNRCAHSRRRKISWLFHKFSKSLEVLFYIM